MWSRGCRILTGTEANRIYRMHRIRGALLNLLQLVIVIGLGVDIHARYGFQLSQRLHYVSKISYGNTIVS
jgi:hypothetical protein